MSLPYNKMTLEEAIAIVKRDIPGAKPDEIVGTAKLIQQQVEGYRQSMTPEEWAMWQHSVESDLEHEALLRKR